MRSPSTLAVCTASGIRLTEISSFGLLDEAAFEEAEEEAEDEELPDTALCSALLSVLLDEVSSEFSELTAAGELLENTTLLCGVELDEL